MEQQEEEAREDAGLLASAPSYDLSSGIYSIVQPKSRDQEVAEEHERVAIEFNLSQEEVEGPKAADKEQQQEPDDENVIFGKSPSTVRKNWAEYGYDLDYVETPDEVLSRGSEDAVSAAVAVMGAGTSETDNLVSQTTLNLVKGLNQFIMTSQQKSIGSSGTNTTKAPSSLAMSPVPDRDVPPHVSFEDFLSDDEDEVSDMWDSVIRGRKKDGAGEDGPPLLDLPSHTDKIPAAEHHHHSIPSDSSNSSAHHIKEHGSTICGMRTRIFILICSLIMLTALLVAGISVAITLATDWNVDSNDAADPSVSDTINIDDFVSPTSPDDPSRQVDPTTSATLATSGTQATTETDPTTPATPALPSDEVAPTMFPTAMPTSVSATGAPAQECQDNDKDEFLLNGATRDCVWLRESTSVDYQISICQWFGPMREACRDTCNTCDPDESTFVPTMAPSNGQGSTGAPIAATMAPSLAPTTSNLRASLAPTSATTKAPSVDPNATVAPTRLSSPTLLSAPTRAPTLLPTMCLPDLPGVVPDESFTCSWLSQTNPSYRTTQCLGGNAWDHCRETCGNCGYPS